MKKKFITPKLRIQAMQSGLSILAASGESTPLSTGIGSTSEQNAKRYTFDF